MNKHRTRYWSEKNSLSQTSPTGLFVANLALKAIHTGQKIETKEALAKSLIAAGHSAEKINYWWRLYRKRYEFYRDDENPLRTSQDVTEDD